jgi:uncharacterized membrane protein YjjB (DUF3815 family)
MEAALRLAVVAVILVLLGRVVPVAWRNRRLAYAVWGRIRPRHVLGGLGLLAVVLTVALALLQYVPVTRYGFGSFVGLHGNAVFAPIEEAAVRAGGEGLTAPAPGGPPEAGGQGARYGLLAAAAAFLGGLVLLFPWLAYVEERTFREGLERATLARELASALRFGLVHLVMLIPLAAALALAVAGFAYGRIYRRAHRRAAARTEEVEGPLGLPVTVAPSPARVRGEAVLEATVWHATVNTIVVTLVFLGLLVEWL